MLTREQHEMITFGLFELTVLEQGFRIFPSICTLGVPDLHSGNRALLPPCA